MRTGHPINLPWSEEDISMEAHGVKIVLLLSALLCAGCNSLIYRFSDTQGKDPPPKYVYSATQVDIRGIADTTKYMETPQWRSNDFGCLWPIAWTYLVIDFPFSLVGDTLFLPYDLVMITVGGRDRYGLTVKHLDK